MRGDILNVPTKSTIIPPSPRQTICRAVPAAKQ
jgi:hypothetical protein